MTGRPDQQLVGPPPGTRACRHPTDGGPHSLRMKLTSMFTRNSEIRPFSHRTC